MSPSAASVDLLSYAPQVARVARLVAKGSRRRFDLRDCEQDGWVALLQILPRYDGRARFVTFSYRRLHGAMIDGLRRWDSRHRGGRPRLVWCALEDAPVFDIFSTRPSPLDELLALERETRLARACRSLSVREAYVVRRLYYDRATYEQIGRELHLTKARIWQLHRSALTRLRTELSR